MNKELFTTTESIAAPLIERYQYPWEVLEHIHSFILELGPKLDKNIYEEIKPSVWVAKSANIAEGVTILGPAIIDEGATLRHFVFLRENVIVGKNCTVSTCSELKNVILFNKVQTPHYNYVGDSILGFGSHIGAAAITSNLKSDKSLIKIKMEDKVYETGRKKMGAILGDYVEVGCGCVLNPGTIIGKHSQIYPLNSVRGYVPPNHIYKDKDNIVLKEENYVRD